MAGKRSTNCPLGRCIGRLWAAPLLRPDRSFSFTITNYQFTLASVDTTMSVTSIPEQHIAQSSNDHLTPAVAIDGMLDHIVHCSSDNGRLNETRQRRRVQVSPHSVATLEFPYEFSDRVGDFLLNPGIFLCKPRTILNDAKCLLDQIDYVQVGVIQRTI